MHNVIPQMRRVVCRIGARESGDEQVGQARSGDHRSLPQETNMTPTALNHSLADCATTLDATVHRRRTKRRLPARFASYIAWSASASNRSTNSASS